MREPETAARFIPSFLEDAKKASSPEKGPTRPLNESGAIWARGDPRRIRERRKAYSREKGEIRH